VNNPRDPLWDQARAKILLLRGGTINISERASRAKTDGYGSAKEREVSKVGTADKSAED